MPRTRIQRDRLPLHDTEIVASVAVEARLDGDEEIILLDEIGGDERAWRADVPVDVGAGRDDDEAVVGCCFGKAQACDGVVEEVVGAGEAAEGGAKDDYVEGFGSEACGCLRKGVRIGGCWGRVELNSRRIGRL